MRRASRSCSINMRMSPSRTGPFTLRTIERLPSNNSTLNTIIDDDTTAMTKYTVNTSGSPTHQHTHTKILPDLRHATLRSSASEHFDNTSHFRFRFLQHKTFVSFLVTIYYGARQTKSFFVFF